ncbi:PAAR domain-containing protein [Pseudomonas syringae]|uniref:PAAR domain-containing protein n=1 Tax=Pseudomonas syringae TaxID=317 RepID=UPI0020C00DD9|nr:PAAR domain-containing protein [Pseudomonas syringae]MCL6306055.1 PAAR domain-containing protein [Pseudomonas syringae]MDF7797523.1 PAAR domain-containing protein [Pseudomonas syringae]
MKLLAIVQGDTTDHGGSVINGDQTMRINGFAVAHRGCDVICPLHGASKILGEENNFHIDGNIIALEGDLTSCGARLISRQQSFFRVGRRSSAVEPAPDTSAGHHQELASEGALDGGVQAVDSLPSQRNSMACDERFRLFNQQRSSLGHLGYVLMQDQHCTAIGALDLHGYSRSHTSHAVTAVQLATTAPWPVME